MPLTHSMVLYCLKSKYWRDGFNTVHFLHHLMSSLARWIFLEHCNSFVGCFSWCYQWLVLFWARIKKMFILHTHTHTHTVVMAVSRWTRISQFPIDSHGSRSPLLVTLSILTGQTKTFKFSYAVWHNSTRSCAGILLCLAPSVSIVIRCLIQSASSLHSTCANCLPPSLIAKLTGSSPDDSLNSVFFFFLSN